MASSQFYIGTSNVVIPGNKLSFPKKFRQVSRLHYYSHLFSSVEINSSFYKTPQKATFQKWASDVTDDFRFSIKLSREITHAKKLAYDKSVLEDFLNKATGIAEKKGCLLIQFPGSLDISQFTNVETLLEDCLQFDEVGWPIAVEFRNPGWYISETYELLNQYKAALVIQDFPKAPETALHTNAPHIYLRFHGERGSYRGSYTNAELSGWSRQIRAWIKSGKTVYSYFNNTIGDAFHNARLLQQLASKSAK